MFFNVSLNSCIIAFLKTQCVRNRIKLPGGFSVWASCFENGSRGELRVLSTQRVNPVVCGLGPWCLGICLIAVVCVQILFFPQFTLLEKLRFVLGFTSKKSCFRRWHLACPYEFAVWYIIYEVRENLPLKGVWQAGYWFSSCCLSKFGKDVSGMLEKSHYLRFSFFLFVFLNWKRCDLWKGR